MVVIDHDRVAVYQSAFEMGMIFWQIIVGMLDRPVLLGRPQKDAAEKSKPRDKGKAD